MLLFLANIMLLFLVNGMSLLLSNILLQSFVVDNTFVICNIKSVLYHSERDSLTWLHQLLLNIKIIPNGDEFE